MGVIVTQQFNNSVQNKAG